VSIAIRLIAEAWVFSQGRSKLANWTFLKSLVFGKSPPVGPGEVNGIPVSRELRSYGRGLSRHVGTVAMTSFFYKHPSTTTLTALTFACCMVSGTATGCRQKTPIERTQEPQVPYQAVANPIWEMCTDDTGSRTEYFNVPVVRFEGPRILLNGVTTSADDLLAWAQKRYSKLAEQAVWVQFSSDNTLSGDHALLPIAEALPRLQIRRVDFNFNCAKLHAAR
jgi:hypothetical protein